MITSVRAYSLPSAKYQMNSNPNKRQYANLQSNLKFGSASPSKELTKFEKIFLWFADTKAVKSVVEWASKDRGSVNSQGKKIEKNNTKLLSQLLMVAFSAGLQTNHVINIMRNKEIPTERKEVLAVNNGLTFVIPTIGAFTLDGVLHNSFDKMQNYIKKVNKNSKINPKTIENAAEGLDKVKTVIVFTMMYKYASTLIAMPMADGVTRFLRRHGVFGEEGKQKELARFKADKKA